jgi:FkbM family methyltransferase
MFEKTVSDSDVVYDIGANVGYYSLLASELVGDKGRVFAFEPQPRAVAYLRKHLEINHVKNVTVLECAVSDKVGKARFCRGLDSSTGHLDNQGENEVSTVTLDSLAKEGRIPPPDVMKIDVEGGELSALTGSQTILDNHHPKIFLEMHGEGPDAEVVMNYLKSRGYKLELLGFVFAHK